MKRINWKDLRTRIPHRIKLGKTDYEIVWVDDFKDGSTLGETRFAPPQIAILNGQSDKETVKVYLHEVCHGISEEEGLALTENQVLGLERSLLYALKPGNIFSDEKKKKS